MRFNKKSKNQKDFTAKNDKDSSHDVICIVFALRYGELGRCIAGMVAFHHRTHDVLQHLLTKENDDGKSERLIDLSRLCFSLPLPGSSSDLLDVVK